MTRLTRSPTTTTAIGGWPGPRKHNLSYRAWLQLGIVCVLVVSCSTNGAWKPLPNIYQLETVTVLGQIATSLQLYLDDYGSYPPSLEDEAFRPYILSLLPNTYIPLNVRYERRWNLDEEVFPLLLTEFVYVQDTTTRTG